MFLWGIVFCSNIPSAPAYVVYFSKLIHYARACSGYQGPVVQSIDSLTSSLVVKNVNCSSKYNI